ncbi:MAG TPA: hypothetical protein VMG12_06510 [Polyangiaceae bacterium]|nr:hypothetical protein [Polyangiaceae bacterium]
MGRWGWVRGVFAVMVGSVGLVPRAASACSYAVIPADAYPVQSNALDTTPPVLLDVSVAELIRGSGVVDSSDCTDPGSLVLATEAHDDQTPPEQLHYRLEVLDGDPRPLFYGEFVPDLVFLVFEGPDDPIDYELRIRAVDQAGNESEPFDLAVRDGVPSEGCGLVRGHASAGPLGLLLFFSLMGVMRSARARRSGA